MPRSRARCLSIGAPILAVSAHFRLRCIHLIIASHTCRAHRSAPPGRGPIRQSTCRGFLGADVTVTGAPNPSLACYRQHWRSSSIGATGPRSHDVCLRSSTTSLSSHPSSAIRLTSAECSSTSGKEVAVYGSRFVLANSPGERLRNGRQ